MDIAPAGQAAAEAMRASYVAGSGYGGPLVQAFAAQGEPLLRAGGRCLVPGGDGRPLAVVRTTEVRAGPLGPADDRFARDEGEGDRTRAWWPDAHTRFFSRQCTAMGVTFSGGISVVFERFELVWPAIRT